MDRTVELDRIHRTVWIIALSPLFAIMWTRLGNRAPTTPRKFAYGVIGAGLAFLMFLLVVGIMAVFSVGLGTSMSGVLARYYDPAHEFAYFGIIGAVAILVGVVAFAIAPWISRLIQGVH